MTVSCTDGTSVTLYSGKNGDPGSNGTNGTNGDAGTSCTITNPGDGGRTLTCTDGTTTPIPGGATCTIKDNGDGGKTLGCTDGTQIQIPTGTAAHNSGTGVKLTISAATIAADGTITVTFKLTDGANVPLDRTGLYTDGAVTVSLIAAWLGTDTDGGAGQYTAYTTRIRATADGGNPVTQANFDTGGVYTELGSGSGTYTYTFATKATVTKPGNTHTIAGLATRTLGTVKYVANTEFHFLPSGGPVTVTRNVVNDAKCNACHGALNHHGGNRRDTQLCITCHTPQTTEPNTNSTVDFKVMIHRIHMGEKLPSVLAGKTIHYGAPAPGGDDYTTVAFPQDQGRCDVCHTTDQWRTKPGKAVCTSCHDDVSFEATTTPPLHLHPGGPQLDDSNCFVCHQSTGGYSPITERHLTPLRNPANPQVTLSIDSFTNTAPGQIPVLSFTAKVNGAGRDLLANPMNRVTVTVGRPNVPDINDYYQERVNQLYLADGGMGLNGTLTAIDAPNGKFKFTFPATRTIPLTATGSGTVGLEGYVQLPGLTSDGGFVTDGGFQTDRFAAVNPVAYFAITDPVAVPRRKIVDVANCNNCHQKLALHGGSRNNPNYCVMCHNVETNSPNTLVPRVEGTYSETTPVHLPEWIHGIHRGASRVSPLPFGVNPGPTKLLPDGGSNPFGTQSDFATARFPGNLMVCSTCHVNNSWQLPLPAGVLPTRYERWTCTESPAADTDNYCDTRTLENRYLPAEGGACNACHDSAAAKTHTALQSLIVTPSQTLSDGGIGAPVFAEACATCHGVGKQFAVDTVHTPAP